MWYSQYSHSAVWWHTVGLVQFHSFTALKGKDFMATESSFQSHFSLRIPKAFKLVNLFPAELFRIELFTVAEKKTRIMCTHRARKRFWIGRVQIFSLSLPLCIYVHWGAWLRQRGNLPESMLRSGKITTHSPCNMWRFIVFMRADVTQWHSIRYLCQHIINVNGFRAQPFTPSACICIGVNVYARLCLCVCVTLDG